MALTLELLEAKVMHHTGGPGWRITMDTYEPMLIALYIRDVAGLVGAGSPVLCQVAPTVHAADHNRLIKTVGGPDALRGEWERWWSGLLAQFPGSGPNLTPPNFSEFDSFPALQRVLRAHFGAALSWSLEQRAHYSTMAAERDARGGNKILAEMVQNRELELGRSARDFTLTIVELPLAEERAWLIEPNKLIMSQHLLDDQQNFLSYVMPVVELLL